MKKLASLILALSLCLALAVPALADYQMPSSGWDNLYSLKMDREPVSVAEPESEWFNPAYTVDVNTTFTFNRLPDPANGHFDISIEFHETNDYERRYFINPKTGSADLSDNSNFYFPNDDAATYTILGGESVSFKLPADLIGKDEVEMYVSISGGVDGSFGDGQEAYTLIPTGTLESAPAAPAQTTTPAPAATTDKPAQTTAPATAAPAATPAGSNTYTAQKYDTYGKLAVNNYGTYAVTKALQKANNYKTLKAGVAVTLPDTLGKVARIAPAAAGEGEKLYTVLAGDTLGTIAKAYFGNSAQYKAIFERNADRLKNANTIYEGQIIVLPAK